MKILVIPSTGYAVGPFSSDEELTRFIAQCGDANAFVIEATEEELAHPEACGLMPVPPLSASAMLRTMKPKPRQVNVRYLDNPAGPLRGKVDITDELKPTKGDMGFGPFGRYVVKSVCRPRGNQDPG